LRGRESSQIREREKGREKSEKEEIREREGGRDIER